jgi:hypothetical protein
MLSPWTYQVIHEALRAGDLVFDAVIIPMRDLTEAASSRAIVEMQAMHRSQSWMGDLEQTWEHYGHTLGGVVYSINPVDLARLLAVGFHQLLEHLVRADVPMIFLSFPRLIEDADYLHRKLAGILPPGITAETGRVAHADTADLSKVWVGAELHAAPPEPAPGFVLNGPGPGCKSGRCRSPPRGGTGVCGDGGGEGAAKPIGFVPRSRRLKAAIDERDFRQSIWQAIERLLAAVRQERNEARTGLKLRTRTRRFPWRRALPRGLPGI